MARLVRPAKYSGFAAPDDVLHRLVRPAVAREEEQYLPATMISVQIVSPQHETVSVPQYAPTVIGGAAAGYDPACDCNGAFMSYKFQPNNNCYAYGSNIATNTFPQPGRRSGYLLTASQMQGTVPHVGEIVASYAQKDGLKLLGTTIADCTKFASGVSPSSGHFVALMISPAGDANWPGDYHWARCDNSSGPCDSWSQKDGNDQVTNFDFAGRPITNPATANWTVNQGPLTNGEDLLVVYSFYCFMFVPAAGVNIV